MKIKATYRAIKRNFRQFFKQPSYRARFYFAKYYSKLEVDEKNIFFESYSGNNFSGNVYYIFKEVIKDDFFKDYKKYIGIQKSKQEDVKNFLNEQGIHDFILVPVNSKEYCKVLITSHYLFNNSTLPTYYIKSNNQILVNTWHGTPLKTLGKKVIGGGHEIGNTQRNYLMSDYIALPNEFTLNHLREDFMLDNMFSGKYILDGYPRNNIFYDKEHCNCLKERLNLINKQIICYMPTWRGVIDRKDSERQIDELRYYLKRIDETLNENKIMYVNLHNFVKQQIDLDEYKYIKYFPKNIETYEFLSISDCLITDYSSVFFDYANLNKKIILFAYDKDEYLSSRGLYFPMEDLPFTIVQTIDELCKELNHLDEFANYCSFIQEYCPNDSRNSAKDILNITIFNKMNPDIKVIEGEVFSNSKKNILIYAGSLAKNGLTSSLKGLINHINLEEYNYTLTFYRGAVRRHSHEIDDFPSKIKYIPIQGKKDITIKESLAQFLYYRFNYNSKWIEENFNSIYEREVERIFPSLNFDYVIHFTGYEKQIVHLFNAMKNSRKIIYVHSNMKKEMEIRSNYHIPSIFQAYKKYDTIVGVREGIDEELLELLPLNKEKIKIVHNVNNIDAILKNAKLQISFEEETESTHTIDEIKNILNLEDAIKFINVARFSPEKGILRLIKAFEMFHEKQSNSYMFIIGGHGAKYNEVLEYVESRKLKNVVLIKSLKNPFTILKKCDFFVLSSYYEGLPMSIMEALILDKPVICTDIEGPRKFLNQGYGYLVEDSVDGLLQGMKDAYEGKVKLKKFDPYDFNEKAIHEFYDLFTN